MAVHVDVPGRMLAWARERSGVDREALERRFPKLASWEAGTATPTLRQLERFAHATHTPIGFLFLPVPPMEKLPIPDFRTMPADTPGRPSPNLLDTIYQGQQRQEWFRDHAVLTGEDPVAIVGSLARSTPVAAAAEAMRQALDFGVGERGHSWSEALRRLSEQAENSGVLVMVNGVVGNNTHRRLDPREFRGFALVDAWAPVVFVNGADTKAAQVFTLAHELAHVWLGETGLDDVEPAGNTAYDVERWCNAVAAEFLVPAAELRSRHDPGNELTGELDRLAREFRVSTLTILNRLHEVGALGWDNYQDAYEAERRRVLGLLGDRRVGAGGDFYHTQPVRVSKRFARELIASTLEGHTLYTDAFRMLGVKKLSTFEELRDHLGVA